VTRSASTSLRSSRLWPKYANCRTSSAPRRSPRFRIEYRERLRPSSAHLRKARHGGAFCMFGPGPARVGANFLDSAFRFVLRHERAGAPCSREQRERRVRTRAAGGAGPWRGPAGRRPGHTFIWAAGMAVRPDPAAIVLLGRARGPSARPLGRSRIVVEGSRGAGQPELMFPRLEFSDVRRCRDGGRLQRVSVHTDRNLPMTSRRVPDVVSPSLNARAAGRSIA
jgi:hypothetical protein